MIVIIDHRDSFTWNIVHLFEAHAPVQVFDHSRLAHETLPENELVVLSPGPGQPSDYPQTLQWLAQAPASQAIFGICLGFQMMLFAEGASVIRQDRVMHGVQTPLQISPENTLYAGLESPIVVGRYHALTLSLTDSLHDYRITAHDPTHAIALSIEHLTLPRFGVQYHPDSFLTPHGARIIENLYRELGRWT